MNSVLSACRLFLRRRKQTALPCVFAITFNFIPIPEAQYFAAFCYRVTRFTEAMTNWCKKIPAKRVPVGTLKVLSS
jgi:hypothetical protein